MELPTACALRHRLRAHAHWESIAFLAHKTPNVWIFMEQLAVATCRASNPDAPCESCTSPENADAPPS